MSETKVREPQFALPDDIPEDHLPEPVPLTPEQYAEAKKREEQYRREWAAINKALRDNSMAVFRAMRKFRHEGEEDYVERVLNSFEDGRLLINRLGAEGVIDQELAVVLLDLRRRLIDEHGNTPAAMMLVDQAVSAYQDFIRVTGWTGNLSISSTNSSVSTDRAGTFGIAMAERVVSFAAFPWKSISPVCARA